jgi:hypothetical protein
MATLLFARSPQRSLPYADPSPAVQTIPLTPWALDLFTQAPQDLPSELLRPTSLCIPATPALFSQCQLPFGFIFNPGTTVPLPQFDHSQSDSVIRCRKCRAFGSKFAKRVSSQRWICPICSRENVVTDASRDLSTTPELEHNLYELKASSTYVHLSNVRPRFLFCVDTSAEAWECGFTQRVLHSIRASILHVSDATELGLLTFDRQISLFYPAKKRFFVVADADAGCCPLSGSQPFTIDKQRIVDAIDIVLRGNERRPGHCLGTAWSIAAELCNEQCAVVLLCGFGRPTVGEGKLNERDYRQLLGTTEEVSILRLPIDDTFYRGLAMGVGEGGASFHMFIAGRGFVDIATLGFSAGLTSGHVCHLPNYEDSLDGDGLSAELHRTITSEYLWDCVLAFHSPKAIKLCKLHAMVARKQKWTYFPSLNADQSIIFEIDLIKELTGPAVCGATLIYTNQRGERVIRSLAWSVTPTKDWEFLQTVDPVAITAITVKNGGRVVLSTQPSSGLVSYNGYLVDTFQLFPLGFPPRLLPYTHFCYALKTSIVFNTKPGVDVDARMASLLNLKGMNAVDVLLWLHPRMIPLAFPETTVPLIVSALDGYPISVIHMVDRLFVWVGGNADTADVEQLFGTQTATQVPELDNPLNATLREIIEGCWALSGKFLPVRVLRPGDGRIALVTQYLVESSDMANHPYLTWYNGMYALMARRQVPTRRK